MTTNPPDKSPYWFPAKKYGWGWGLPTCWQGMAVLAGFVLLVVLNSILFPPPAHFVAFFVGIAVLCALLMVVCYLKGEPPGWRWGK
jgi:hypothetical protein